MAAALGEEQVAGPHPREGHGWTEREHQIDSWNRTRDWLARHL